MKLIHNITATKHWACLGSELKYRSRRGQFWLPWCLKQYINTYINTFIQQKGDFFSLCTVTFTIFILMLFCVCMCPCMCIKGMYYSSNRLHVWPWPSVCIRNISPTSAFMHFYVEVNKFAADQLLWAPGPQLHARTHKHNTHILDRNGIVGFLRLDYHWCQTVRSPEQSGAWEVGFLCSIL